MLQLTNVTVSSPSKVILDDLSLTVSAGEAVGIVGESGSGKTTILKLLLGLPLAKEVFLIRIRPLAHKRSGFLIPLWGQNWPGLPSSPA